MNKTNDFTCYRVTGALFEIHEVGSLNFAQGFGVFFGCLLALYQQVYQLVVVEGPGAGLHAALLHILHRRLLLQALTSLR